MPQVLFFILVDLFNWAPYFEEERLEWLKPKKPVHEQDDGVILAMCITGTSSRDVPCCACISDFLVSQVLSHSTDKAD
jgi:hypothetical protein